MSYPNSRFTRTLSVIGAAAVLIVATAFVARLYADPPKTGTQGGPPGGQEMTAEQKAAMEAMMAYGTPGRNHKFLDAFIGDWITNSKFWETPEGKPEESTGTANFKWIFEGRYLVQDVDGSAMGQPFKGHGLMAYDNLLKKYQSTWIDSWSTGIMYMTGTSDPSGKVFSSEGEMANPCLGKVVNARMKHTIVDQSKHVLEMWSPDKTGKVYKCMEITYTRK
jgi:hypothetical protein